MGKKPGHFLVKEEQMSFKLINKIFAFIRTANFSYDQIAFEPTGLEKIEI